MSDSWDMSFLIDQATRIHEARGNFGNLATSAARQAGGKLGMTMFQSKAVSERSFGKMTKERREELDKRIGEVLVEATDTGIVTKPDAGQYAVLHGESVSPQQISERIVAAAGEMAISEEELGLSSTTETLGDNVEAEEVGRMIRDMRQKLVARATREPIPERVQWGEAPEE